MRSPVADALVRAIRAAVGVGEFTMEDADELIRYAVRRGLVGADEGDRVLAEVQEALKAKRKAARGAKAPKVKPKKAKASANRITSYNVCYTKLLRVAVTAVPPTRTTCSTLMN